MDMLDALVYIRYIALTRALSSTCCLAASMLLSSFTTNASRCTTRGWAPNNHVALARKGFSHRKRNIRHSAVVCLGDPKTDIGSEAVKTAKVLAQAALMALATPGASLAEEDGGVPLGLIALVLAGAGAAFFATQGRNGGGSGGVSEEVMKKNMTVRGRAPTRNSPLSLDDLPDDE
eukprot:CAMPEP_0114322894 /NCGR_PEP_ID=MMETSP0059-20121206/27530_1 /TAXON_ID=36894 /ORGANISM="Pyramimonas parkeae, Strain CCMP726" /LENGTH=175 /DNA_ID=CAMNT_0001451023 /DNA_START=834 /DNA_END=1361 /DNA_ORIENTATION=-